MKRYHLILTQRLSVTLTGGVWHGPKVTMERKKTGEKGKACLNRKLVLSKGESVGIRRGGNLRKTRHSSL